ncbi:MAG: peptidoglycan DD-metalloendopeptidase family protein [Gammaproteobacteria bacterium]|nr:MAG: peptidoglycan DD-metalloendopeptidase family protein [Gammaproteobacteria bacterium]
MPRLPKRLWHITVLATAVGIITVTAAIVPDDASARRAKQMRADPAGHLVTINLPLPYDRLKVTHNERTADARPSDREALQEYRVKRGDNLANIFRQQGYSAKDLHAIMQLGKKTTALNRIRPGDTLRFWSGNKGELRALQYLPGPTRTLDVVRTENGFKATNIAHELESRVAYATGTIKNSLFLDGGKAGLSDRLIMAMVDIFGWDIDFALDLRSGDRFSVIFEEHYQGDEKITDGAIIAAEFVNKGKTYRAIRFADANGYQDYYSPEGKSMRKSFLRTPVKFSRISSRYNLRRKHPVLNRIRAHKGVDYAARTGTPVRTTGDGVIRFKGRKGGYGKTVIINHANGYSTLYAHMSGYRKGARKGKRVKQGDTIGYVGKTGLATGPHLHYEFRVRGRQRNPLTVKLPKAKSIARKYRKAYLAHAAPLNNQLDLIARYSVAFNTE